MSEQDARIPVQVRRGAGRLLFATSPALPGLLVTAISEDELATEVPACIRMLTKAARGADDPPVALTSEDKPDARA